MSVFLRGSVYWCRFTTPAGERIRRSCQTSDRKAAEQYEAALKLTCWKADVLGERPDRLWGDLAARWLDEKAENRSIHSDLVRLSILLPYIGNLRASEVTREKMQAVMTRLAADRLAAQARQPGRTLPPKPLKPATLNHYLDVVRRVLNTAKTEWGWVDHVPSFKFYKVCNKRRRVESPANVCRIARCAPDHLADIIVFAVMTGIRLGAILQLQWRWVDWERRAVQLPASVMKSEIDLAIPLNRTAWAAMSRQVGKHEDFVFTYRGRRIGEINESSFCRACEKAGVTDFKMHDLRRSFATWLGSLGAHDRHIKALGAWQQEDRTNAMFRYVWAELEPLRKVAEMLDALWDEAEKANGPEGRR